MFSGAAMIPEEVKSPDAEPSNQNEEAQPTEDPDKIRGEVFKMMFPDTIRKTAEHSKKGPQ